MFPVPAAFVFTFRSPKIVPPVLSSLPSSADVMTLFCTGLVDVSLIFVSTVTLPLPPLKALLSMYCLTTLFWTGFEDASDIALSTIVLFAPLLIPSNLTLSAAAIKPLDVCVAAFVSALPSNAALMTLFCTGFSDAASSVASTTVLFAPFSMPSSLTLSDADIRPSLFVVATALTICPETSAILLSILSKFSFNFSISTTSEYSGLFSCMFGVCFMYLSPSNIITCIFQ